MKSVLFLIHDLGQGGAEKVLVNLVNNMDRKKFNISVMALFGGGINEQFLAPDIKYYCIFPKQIPGNSHLLKLFSPKQLHSMFIKDHYDIEIAYLEGPAARIISGCDDSDTKLLSWVHCTMMSSKDVAESFRSRKEAEKCYNKMHQMIFVSEGVRCAFLNNCIYKGKTEVIYNTIESSKILKLAQEEVAGLITDKKRLVAVGSLKAVKGFDRLLRIIKRLRDDNYPVYLYLLGVGPMQKSLEQYIAENSLENNVSLLGYQTNPYKYVSKCELFICSSYSEGFSTAVTESLIVGTPVCTVEVSGMKEMLGNNNEYGIITKNDENDLYLELRKLLDDPSILEHYKLRARKRGEIFRTEQTVSDVEKMLTNIY